MFFKKIMIPSLLIIISCTHNYEPVITSIVADPNPAQVNELVSLVCNAKDDDTSSSMKDEELTYEWIAASGLINVGQSFENATWVAPSEPGFYSITCKVVDNYNGTDIETISIEVQ